MKKILAAAFFIGVLFYSCSTDFEVTSGWKDITIVYGLLDPSDTAQYIKITKAFLDPKTNALSIAQIPDSLYYSNIDVRLEEWSNNAMVTSFPMTAVDGNNEGYPKDSGIFAQAPNTVYKTTNTLNQNSSYRLVITENEDGKVISSTTEIINDFQVLRPTPLQKVNFSPGHNYTPDWYSAQDGKTYGLTLRFHYTEHQIADTSIKEEKYIDWIVFNSLRTNTTNGGIETTYDIPANSFYNTLNQEIEDNPSVFRVTGSLDFLFSVGGESLDTYNQVAIAQQGLTSGQIEPEYTNIDNGIGLFSSRFNKNILNVPIDPKTIDTIACGPILKHLNFKNSIGFFCQ